VREKMVAAEGRAAQAHEFLGVNPGERLPLNGRRLGWGLQVSAECVERAPHGCTPAICADGERTPDILKE
jgi:hypothetical protein